MLSRVFSLVLLLLPLTLIAADPDPAGVAFLVNEPDTSTIVEPLRAALASSDALSRATAARVIAARNLPDLMPALREQLARESDGTAALEEVTALAMTGSADDVDFAVAASAKWPRAMDDTLARAVARRAGKEPVDMYFSRLSRLRGLSRQVFFRFALWGRAALIPYAASRLIGVSDVAGWHDLLAALVDSAIALDPGMLGVALDAPTEEIRNDAVWYVARGYTHDPAQIPAALREKFESPAQTASDREAFGREIVRRMLGARKKDDERMLRWLESFEADEILGPEEDSALFSWFTDREFATRKKRCGVQTIGCRMPERRRDFLRSIRPKPVAPADFTMPDLLPAGLAASLLKCADGWIGVAAISVDPAGRVRHIDLGKMKTGRCQRALETILRLSLATNTSMTSPHQSNNVLLVRAAGQPLCLDEEAPSDVIAGETLRIGGRVTAPVVVRRVEPYFPQSARRAMAGGQSAIIVIECIISKEGCVRNIRPVLQTPFPEVNGAAIEALSQWKFKPGTLEGRPVDVLFNLSVNFKMW